jgi:signal transduction histidine kinase
LFAVARIIGQHGGTITARNRPAGGAEFTIAIPVN